MNEIYRFGPFQADLPNRQLSQEGRPIPLTPKVFQTLEVLLRNRDRVIPKHELLSAIWPESHVEEANLTQNISVLRKALGETNSANKFIATFPKQGYRFIGIAEEESRSPSLPLKVPGAAPVPTSPRRFRYIWLAGLALLPITALAVSSLVRTGPAADLGEQHAITHLPGRAYQPVLSPDGARVAFVSHRALSGPLRIGVLELGVSAEPRILDTGDGDAFSPAWSPDGRRLAYLHADHELRSEPVCQVVPELCSSKTLVNLNAIDLSADHRPNSADHGSIKGIGFDD